MDADEKSDPPGYSDADFTTTWPLGTDESNNLYFFGPDANILGWNLHPDHHHQTRCFGDVDQIELAELGYHGTAAAACDFAGNLDLQSCSPRFQSPIDPAAVADADESSSKPSVSSGSSEDPSEKSTAPVVRSPEIPNKAVRKKGQKRIKQPRFAFMTKSKVDHLEDGYRWRKYGQKAVKNSPFPRSYYRCTNSKCTVKKRVERSSKDPDTVITTYEGQHCHHAAGFPRGGAISAREAAPYYPQFNNYPRIVATQPRDHVTSSSSANHQAGDQPYSNVLLSPPRRTPQLQLAVDQGLLGDIVPPTMRN